MFASIVMSSRVPPPPRTADDEPKRVAADPTLARRLARAVRRWVLGWLLRGDYRSAGDRNLDGPPITIADELFVLASVTDISTRLQLEQETALHRDELAHLSRVTLLGEMSGSLAHELNQPLTAVLSNAQAALRFLQHEHPDLGEVRDSLTHIVENDKRASEVIRRLRAMLRKEQVDYQLPSINEVVRDMLRLINNDLLNRGVAVSLDLPEDLPLAKGDRVQLQQVLLNLVLNACDAMEQMVTGRVVTVRTQASPGSGVEVSISDVGRGIPEDQLEGSFAPFNTSKAEGIGVGLAICRTIVAAHHGTVGDQQPDPWRHAAFRAAGRFERIRSRRN